METMNMDYDGNDETQQLSADTLPFARSYQLEALEKALKQNTIVFLETGSGKTLIAIMLLRSYAYLLRKPSRNLAIFVVPQVVLVAQQAEAVKMHTDLKVGMYWGDMGVDYWDEDRWKKEQGEHEVLVMTPAILLDGLRHCFFKLDMIKVLIFDECHHATGKHPYACIMTEFYHRQLHSDSSNLPKIFGMTASPVNSKGSNSASDYWQKIQNLENILNSKVYTCVNESVLAEFIPFSDTKIKIYKHVDIPYTLFKPLADDLKILKEKHQLAAKNLELKGSVGKKISKLYSVYLFCLNDLGVWLALRAAEFLSVCQTDIFLWGNLDIFGETIIKDFSKDVFKVFSTYIPSGSELSISDNLKANMDEGFLTSKVLCLIECLLEYRHVKDLRCIIFVERVITSIVLQILLDKVLPKQCGWNAKYIAGRNSGLQSQTRKDHNELVKEFRKGTVNVIVATSILEEGLDVQSCNLVIRFDPSANVCSFIQSRGRARMQNSDFVVMVRSGDSTTFSRVQNYLSSGDVMREESLRHAALPCEPLERDLSDEEVYLVESTGAIVTLSSSIALIYFYCSRLPSDGYFKPHPTCNIDKESGLCTLTLPKSCPIPPICAQGDVKMLKKIACLEACKKLHEIGELTDNLVPKIVVEAADSNDFEYDDKQLSYFPPELVNQCQNSSKTVHHCYLIELKPNFAQEIEVHDIVLAVRTKFDSDVLTTDFDLEVDGGSLTVRIKYVGELDLTPEKVLLCRMFQFVLLKVLIDHDLDKVEDIINGLHRGNDLIVDYLLLPSTILHQRPLMIDWNSISSVLFSCNNGLMGHKICYPSRVSAHGVQTKDGLVCSCMLENAVVCTPHNGRLYYISGFIDDLDGRSLLCSKNEGAITYKEYFESRHGIELRFEQQTLLFARRIFRVQNQLQSGRQWMEKVEKEKELRKTFVELPPELCSIIMSPLSIRTLYSFLFVPSIMHRIESLLLATNLKKMHSDHCKQNGSIPTIKVLEAITTKKCQEAFHLESLETLGDSFLKYAACQQLFKTYQNHHEGLLTAKKDKIISNAALCKFGCERKIPGFICDEFFDPKTWVIPGVQSGNCILKEELLSTTRSMYVRGKMKLKGKRVADVVEALIGAYLSTGGETSALLFLDWLGIEVDFVHKPYERIFQVQPERLVNVRRLENLLNYSFRDPSLLVEALTHGSYMLPEISRSYQRLEFLGDSVLDYVITKHLYYKYPGLSPGLLTELRSASVNNDCYAQCTVRAELYKHILHLSPKLHKHIVETVENFKQMSLELTFGWESESSFPKVLGDVIESLAGAILVDSGYNEEVVFNSIRPLLEPIVTPETVRYHPAKEINEFCQKKHYTLIKTVNRDNGRASYTVEVEADGVMHEYTCFDNDKRTAKKVACKNVLKSLKEAISEQEQPESTSS